jgi:putative ABC transport system permease protein
MWTLAWKNLLKERVRLFISVGGVAFSVMLIVLLRGLFISYEHKAGRYFDHVGADAWVWQRNTASIFNSISLVPDALRSEIARMSGVKQVRPFVVRPVGLTIHAAQTSQLVVGFDPQDPVTGPVRLVRGTLNVGSNGIIVDEVFAHRYGVGLGDRLTILGHHLTVVGIGAEGDMVLYQYAFVSMRTARTLMQMPRLDNALILMLNPGASRVRIAAQIEALSPSIVVKSSSQVVAEHQQVVNDAFLPVIAVLLTLGFLVGGAVIGLTIYSSVLEKRREYGMLKAIGAQGYQTAFVILAQAVLTGIVGYLAGVGLAHLAGPVATAWVPQFVTEIVPTDLAWIALVAIGTAVLASAIPLVRINRIDPAEVFRA